MNHDRTLSMLFDGIKRERERASNAYHLKQDNENASYQIYKYYSNQSLNELHNNFFKMDMTEMRNRWPR